MNDWRKCDVPSLDPNRLASAPCDAGAVVVCIASLRPNGAIGYGRRAHRQAARATTPAVDSQPHTSETTAQQDFSYADLRGLDLLRPSLSERLAGLSFSQAYTSPAYQNGEDLFTAVLGEVRLTGARLDRVDLHGAYLSKANLRAASLRGTDLRRAVLNQAVLVGADLRNANLARARLFAADLRNADLSGADLTGANLRDADLRGARLSGARLAGAILIGARTGIGDANPRPPK